MEAGLRAVVRHLRGAEPDGQTIDPGTCKDCGYVGRWKDVAHGCVGCMACPQGPPQLSHARCRLCEPVCPVCDNGFLPNPEAGQWAKALMAAEAALAGDDDHA
jgi:hypothetical protein